MTSQQRAASDADERLPVESSDVLALRAAFARAEQAEVHAHEETERARRRLRLALAGSDPFAGESRIEVKIT